MYTAYDIGTFHGDFEGYSLYLDEIGAVAYINGQPAARSTSIDRLKDILSVIVSEESRHTEEYK